MKAQPPEESEPAILPRDWAGKPNYCDFIHAEDCEDIRILAAGSLISPPWIGMPAGRSASPVAAASW